MDCRDVTPGSFFDAAGFFCAAGMIPRGIKNDPPNSFIYTQRTTSRVSTAVFTSSSIFSESFVSEF